MSVSAEQSKWQLCHYDRKSVTRLAHSLGLFETTAALLVRRGVSTPLEAEKFLHPKLSDLYSPFLMCDMARAVERIDKAIARGEKILVYGDYDVDGTTATVILKKALETVGAAVNYYIPQRLVDGYGMRESAIDKAGVEGYKLIISVDCGIRAHAVIEYATSLGIDVIITDHHIPEGELPAATAILNPKRPDCNYPDKNLAGCGVAFKLAQALLSKYLCLKELPSLLMIAAIGTIADIVPLVGENRVIAKCGLIELSRSNNIGLRALFEISGINGRQITCYDIGYKIAPRINAVGRMGGASSAVEIFSAPTLEIASQLAKEMNEQNIARQRTEADIISEIMLQLENEKAFKKDSVIVLAGERWHRGVIGIAASKVVEKTQKPAVVISIEDGIGYGSGRSIKEFPILEAFDNCPELFEHYGGHSHAAGLTLKAENIGELKRRVNEFAKNFLAQEEPNLEKEIDGKLGFAEINYDLMKEIVMLEPFGAANPIPVFLTENVKIVDGPHLVRDRHLKFRLSHCGHTLDAIWWGAAEYINDFSSTGYYRLVFSLAESNYFNAKNMQIAIKELFLI
ncbi:MAG: single-stranded-DNA-specific exonuclease RecJ [Acidobacteria bacterium]|nr:single-stranded-DNA-specific exonuclease RecJ [Acidobacteriota bacterium]